MAERTNALWNLAYQLGTDPVSGFGAVRMHGMCGLFLLAVLIASNGPPQTATSDNAPIADGETAFYHGTINGTLEVELTLTRRGKVVVGTYEYAAHQQPLRLQGALPPDGSMKIAEFSGGEGSGDQFLLDDLLGEKHLDGTWNSTDGRHSYPVHLGKLDEPQHRQLHKMWNDKEPIKSISLGEFYGCALRESGAWCWGEVLFMPSLAAAGPGMIAQRALPNLLIPAGTSMVSISGSQTCLLLEGAMDCWQRSSKMDWFLFKPTMVKGFDSGVTAIGAGEGFACGIVQEQLKCWDDTLMNPENFITVANDVTGLSSRSPRCGLFSEGFKCWTISVRYAPHAFQSKEQQSFSGKIEHLAASESHGYEDSLVCWTQSGALKCSAEKFRPESDKRVAAANQFTDGVTDVAVVDDHSCIIWKDDVYCWGENTHGQLGDSGAQLAAPTDAPVKVILPSRPRQVAVASQVSCALTFANEVYCWGANDFGQTGAASHDSCSMPNGHFDKISGPCNLKPARVRGLP
ncbi:MAG: RCC1 domain-containing protein [Candidatus Acidiferrales bacterium]